MIMSTELDLPPPPEGAPKLAATTYKILIIGDSNVGKTSLLNRYCDDKFQQGALVNTVGERDLMNVVRSKTKTCPTVCRNRL